MIKLTITEKGGEPKALSFEKDEITIGRVSGNDIVLPKGNVSKRHSRLSVRGGQFEIADLKSTNGTYVNGRKIADPMVLSGTDRVYVGDFLITIEGIGAGEGASASRKMPPPPPPARTGSSAARMPVPEETTGMGEGDDEAAAGAGDAGQSEEEDMALAARPPRSSGRLPVPPPPPPPRRPPTPLASPALDDDGLSDVSSPSPREIATADENTGSSGLFERRKPADDDHGAFDGAAAKGATTGTGRRPGAALPAEPAGSAPFDLGASQPGVPSAGGDGGLLEPLDLLLAEPAVTQVLITGPDAIYVDRGAGPVQLATGLGDLNAVADALWRIANLAVPPPPPDNPVVDVRLPDGTRIAAVFPPTSPRGVVASIRKPGLPERALGDLCPPDAKDLETLLGAAVTTRRNLLLTGEPGAVAALAGALAGAIPTDRRVVSVGGAPARTRAGWTDLATAADMSALVRVAAAMGANHLLWAESAGTEAMDLLLAATRGQEGLVIALPARTPAEGLARLEALATPAVGSSAGTSAGALIASVVDLVVHAVSMPEGGARVVEVVEPTSPGERGGHVGVAAVAAWRADGGKRGGGNGKLAVEGVSARLGAAFEAAGNALPNGLVRGA